MRCLLPRSNGDYNEHNKTNTRAFVWAKSAAEITFKVNRGQNTLKMTSLKGRVTLQFFARGTTQIQLELIWSGILFGKRHGQG